MSRTISISDTLYFRLEEEARFRGVPVEQLFEQWLQEGLRRLEKKAEESEKLPLRTEEAGDEQVDHT